MAAYAYLNNEFVPEKEAVLSVRDLAIQRGYGIFDFLKVSDGVPLFLEDHLDRFFFSAMKMDLPIRRSKEELKEIVDSLIAKNGMGTSGIRLTLTGGVSEDGYSISEPNFIITESELKPRSEALFERGMKLITQSYKRQLPEVKSIDYLMAIRLQSLVRQSGADDVVYTDDGLVLECPRTNIFIVTKDGEVVTPGREILRGITRKKVLEAAGRHHTVGERDITVEELMGAKEVFITSTSKGVIPVVEVDGQKISDGKAGPIAHYLDRELLRMKWVYINGYSAQPGSQ